MDNLDIGKLKQIMNESSTDKKYRKGIEDKLKDALTYLGYISYDSEWKKFENDAIKIQSSIEKLMKKLKI